MSKKGSLLDRGLDRIGRTKIGNIFINPDEDDQDREEAKSEGSGSAPKAVPTPSQFQARPIMTQPAQVFIPQDADPEMKSKLEAIVAQADQKSYTMFANMLGMMRKSFPNEPDAYRGALAAVLANGVSAQDIIRGIGVILADLEKWEGKFKLAIPGRIQEKTQARQTAIGNIKSRLDMNQARMRELEAEMNSLQAQNEQLLAQAGQEQAAIAHDEAAIRDTERKFDIALRVVREPLISEMEKIKTMGGSLNG